MEFLCRGAGIGNGLFTPSLFQKLGVLNVEEATMFFLVLAEVLREAAILGLHTLCNVKRSFKYV